MWTILSSGREVQAERILCKQALLKHFFSSFGLPRTLVTFPRRRFVRPTAQKHSGFASSGSSFPYEGSSVIQNLLTCMLLNVNLH